MKRLFCCVLILPLLLTACADKREFQALLSEANALHEAQTDRVMTEDIRQYLRAIPSAEVGFTEEELKLLTADYGSSAYPTNPITLEQAEQDVDLLFRALYYCYGAYEYFGGSAAFDGARESILGELRALKSPFQTGALTNSLKKHLAFVQDAHFTLNFETLNAPEEYYHTEALVFLRDEKGYFTHENGKKSYLLSVNGDAAAENYMKLSIGEKGRLVYYMGMLSDAGERRLNVSAEFEAGSVELSLEKYYPNVAYNPRRLYDEDFDAKLPTVSCRSYSATPDASKTFVSSAKRLKERSVAVLDIRGNRGGDGWTSQQWLTHYDLVLADSMLGSSSFYIWGKAANYIMAQCVERFPAFPSFDRTHKDLYEAYMERYEHGDNGCSVQRENRELSKSKGGGLLFVLVDSATASTAEWLMAALRGRENVLFVGTNSFGAMRGTTGIEIVLPNSKNHIVFGDGLMFWQNESVFREGRGFLPDIWVGGDALERVQKLVSYYGLQ